MNINIKWKQLITDEIIIVKEEIINKEKAKEIKRISNMKKENVEDGNDNLKVMK